MQKSKSWLSGTSSKLTERCHLFCLLSVLWHIICYKAFICTSLHFSCCWRFFLFHLFIFSNRAFFKSWPFKAAPREVGASLCRCRRCRRSWALFTPPLNAASSLNRCDIIQKNPPTTPVCFSFAIIAGACTVLASKHHLFFLVLCSAQTSSFTHTSHLPLNPTPPFFVKQPERAALSFFLLLVYGVSN